MRRDGDERAINEDFSMDGAACLSGAGQFADELGLYRERQRTFTKHRAVSIRERSGCLPMKGLNFQPILREMPIM